MDSFDNVLLGMAQRHDSISHFMETFFSFLERKTDFFHVITEQQAPMGFPPGASERLINDLFKKFQGQYERRAQPHLQEKLAELNAVDYHRNALNCKLPNKLDKASLNQKPEIKKSTVSPTPITSQKENIDEHLSKENITPAVISRTENKFVPENTTKISSTSSKMSTMNGTDEPEKNYRWSQTLKDITCEIDLFSECKSKDIKIELKQKPSPYVKVIVKGGVLLEGELGGSTKVGEDAIVWTLESGKRINITIEKSVETWWASFLKGDSEIDTTKVHSSKRVEEFDDETQGSIRKIIYDQNRKMQGLPTSDEEIKEAALKKAWNVEGSPFKGTPFDPSILSGGNNNPPPDFE